MNGREFEEYVFGLPNGVTDTAALEPPIWKEFFESMQDVMLRVIWKEEEEVVQIYDPSNPTWGETGRIWNAVRRHLPRRVSKRGSHSPMLYISAGHTSLDFWHGVDAFFWWEGVHATIDISTKRKTKIAEGKEHLKASFCLTPEVLSNNLDDFARAVAVLLRRRNRDARERKEKTRDTIVHFIESGLEI